MVWCGWDKKLWLSTSLNLEAWEPPRLLLVGKWVPCPQQQKHLTLVLALQVLSLAAQRMRLAVRG